jgi:hypothetical protein
MMLVIPCDPDRLHITDQEADDLTLQLCTFHGRIAYLSWLKSLDLSLWCPQQIALLTIALQGPIPPADRN